MRCLLLCLLSYALQCMQKDTVLREKLEGKLCAIIEAARKNPGKNHMCLHEVMETIVPIMDIINHPREYVQKLIGGGTHGTVTIRQALELFFDQPLIMDIGHTVDDSLLDTNYKLFDKSLLDDHRYFFRKKFMSTLKRGLLGT